MRVYSAITLLAIYCSTTGCDTNVSNDYAVTESEQVLKAGGPTSFCSSAADCDGTMCIVDGMGLGPVGRCYDHMYVWCSTWPTPAFSEASDPDSEWLPCGNNTVFAMCQPELSPEINKHCYPVKEYNPRTEYYRYSCCDSAMFGE